MAKVLQANDSYLAGLVNGERYSNCVGEVPNKLAALICQFIWMVYLLPLLLPMVLLALTIWHFWRGGCPRSAGSGKYLTITWKLERSSAYRVTVFLMSVSPTTLMLWALRAQLFHPELFDQEGLEVVKSAYLDYFVFLYSLKIMAFPLHVHNDWDASEFQQLNFKRSFVNMMSSNDVFCVALTKALFQAQCGEHILPLKEFVHRQQEEEDVVSACRRAEQQAVRNELRAVLNAQPLVAWSSLESE